MGAAVFALRVLLAHDPGADQSAAEPVEGLGRDALGRGVDVVDLRRRVGLDCAYEIRDSFLGFR